MNEPGPDRPSIPDEEIPPPIGTLFFVTLYLMVMAGMWGAIYILMLER